MDERLELFTEYFSTYMIDAREFTDSELQIILGRCSVIGLDSLATPESFRHHQYHCLSANLCGERIVKVAITKEDRDLVPRSRFIKEMGQYFDDLLFDSGDKTLIKVYCTGAPNFFIFGREPSTGITYSLINNQYWIRASKNLTDNEIKVMTVVDEQLFIQVN